MASRMDVDHRPPIRDVTAQLVSDVGEAVALSRNSPSYDIYRSGCKRLAFTVINKKFINPEYEERKFAQMDNALNVFVNNFGFDPCNSQGKDHLENVTYEQLESELENLKHRLDTESVSCLAVTVSSHGKEDAVASTRKLAAHRAHFIICSDGKAFPTTKLVDMLTCTRKIVPVIYLIQACRNNRSSSANEQVDHGVSLAVLDANSDDEETEARPPPEQPRNSFPVRDFHHLPVVPPCAPDSVVVFASSEGRQSYIEKSTGSWLLDSLQLVVDDMVDNGDHEVDLFPLLYRTNRRIAGRVTSEGKLKAAGSFTHQMTKSLKFTINA